jgi:uncharacterized membrane protein
MMLKTTLEQENASWQVAAAIACFVIAVVAGLVGFLLTTDWILNAEHHPALHALGLTSLILALPVLILGGHCLDLMDRKRNRSNVV